MHELINRIAGSKRLSVGLLFFVALTTRVALVSFVHTDLITNDGIGYMRLSANVARGDGYVDGYRGHNTPHFFREPGYPIFLASIIATYEKFHGQIELSNEWGSGQYVIPPEVRPMTQTIKYVQAVLDAFNIVLIFAILSLVLGAKPAFLITFCYIFYYPGAIGCSFVQREILQTTEVLGIGYFFARFLLEQKKRWIALTGLLLGLTILTLQAMAAIGLFIFIFILVRQRRLGRAVVYSGLCGLITIAAVSPWVLRTYRHYPDWRVIKTFGTGLTYEWMEYKGAVNKADYYGTISEKEVSRLDRALYADVRGGGCLENSFNGYYEEQARKLNDQIQEPFFSARRLKTVRDRLLKNTLANRCWFPRHFRPGFENNPYYDLIPIEVSIFLSLLTAAGICLWYRKLYIIAMPMTCFISLFYLLASENRRIIPISAFLFTFACLALFSLYRRLVRKQGLRQQFEQILRPRGP